VSVAICLILFGAHTCADLADLVRYESEDLVRYHSEDSCAHEVVVPPIMLITESS
jgi:hypothetical protein